MNISTYTTIILPVALFAFETWPLIFREGQKLRVFENRVLRKMFGTKTGKVIRGCRKLHNEAL
jgi:hypothetical protein